MGIEIKYVQGNAGKLGSSGDFFFFKLEKNWGKFRMTIEIMKTSEKHEVLLKNT